MIAFLAIILIPVVLTGVAVCFLLHYKVQAIGREYGIENPTYESIYNNSLMISKMMDAEFQSLKQQAEEHPEQLEDNAYLNQLGLETLGLRMQRHCDNAYELAGWIDQNYPDITVNYPGLLRSPWHEIADKQFTKGFGGIFTLRVGSKERAFRFINALQIPYIISNIGDTKTLVIHPASTIALHSTQEEQEAAGVFDDLVRVSVGIEDVEDLKEDFAQAIAQI